MAERVEQSSGDDNNGALVPEFTPEELQLLFDEPPGCIDDQGFTAAFTRAQEAGFPNVWAAGPEGDAARARVAAAGERMITEAKAGRAGVPAVYAEYLGKLLENF